jgi:uncharacterized membrane protein YciS (DUF1049 family)
MKMKKFWGGGIFFGFFSFKSRHFKRKSRGKIKELKKNVSKVHIFHHFFINSSIKKKTLQKKIEANSTQCSQAVTHPSTD